MVKVISQTKTDNLDDQDYNVINQNHDAMI